MCQKSKGIFKCKISKKMPIDRAPKGQNHSNLNIKISGTNQYTSGTAATAYAQSIAPGTVVEIGTTITVYFRDESVADDVENVELPGTGN